MIPELVFFTLTVFALKKYCRIRKNNTKISDSVKTLAKAVEVVKHKYEL